MFYRNTPRAKFIGIHIRDSGVVFSISWSLVKISLISLISSLSLRLYLNSLVYNGNIFESSSNFKVFGNIWKSSGNLRKRSSGLQTIFGELSEIFGKWKKILGKSPKALCIMRLKENYMVTWGVFTWYRCNFHSEARWKVALCLHKALFIGVWDL